jgi:hypothetical protein
LGDILTYDWSDVDFILANSTCFDMDLMHKIAEKASLCKIGTWFVTLTKRLPTSDPLTVRDESKRDWDCVYSIKKYMSWGLATVNIHRKIK